MKYKKAQDIMPNEIIKMIQEYADGTYIYIPRRDENKKAWGQDSGAVKNLESRNKKIISKYNSGVSVRELTRLFYLSESSIRRIIRIYKNT